MLPAYSKAPPVAGKERAHHCSYLQDEGVTLQFELWGARGSEGQGGYEGVGRTAVKLLDIIN